MFGLRNAHLGRLGKTGICPAVCRGAILISAFLFTGRAHAQNQPAVPGQPTAAAQAEAKESPGSATQPPALSKPAAPPAAAGTSADTGKSAATGKTASAGKTTSAAQHDATDVGHQNAGPMLEDPSQWKSDLAIGTLLVFLGLLVLLTKFAWRPIMDGLENRERAIEANIERARQSADMAAAQLRQYEAKLAAATEEAREIIGQARKDADAARERIMADAQEAAKRERQRAVEDIAGAKNQALREITEKSVDLAVNLAGRVVKRQLTREDHAQLIQEVLEKFPSQN